MTNTRSFKRKKRTSFIFFYFYHDEKTLSLSTAKAKLVVYVLCRRFLPFAAVERERESKRVSEISSESWPGENQKLLIKSNIPLPALWLCRSRRMSIQLTHYSPPPKRCLIFHLVSTKAQRIALLWAVCILYTYIHIYINRLAGRWKS